MSNPFISIIIPSKNINGNLKRCIDYCLKLNYPDFEIIVAPDKDENIDLPNVKIVATGKVKPGIKRDIASKEAKGEIFAFIDDDAYPDRDWLVNAVKNFKDAKVAAVGGPAVTSSDDTLKEKASGKVYETFIVAGPYRYRYIKCKRDYVKDLPSCNYLIRKDVFDKLGGFNTTFWPGEDTKLSHGIIDKLKMKIIYDPEVLVYHHRRTLFLPHLKQIANYALHRGYFIKKYPKNSFNVYYFLPSILVLGLIFGFVLSLVSLKISLLFLCFLIVYLGTVFIFSLNKNIKMFLLVFSGIILSNITYGLFFLKGLFSKRLKEE